MTQLRRVLAVTAGLVVVGAATGALAGAVVAALVGWTKAWPYHSFHPDLFVIGALIGAPLGAVLLPAAGWLLMRHVPLGRALVGTVAGTVLGGVIGWFAPVGQDLIDRSLAFAVGGFVVSVWVLRAVAARRVRAAG